MSAETQDEGDLDRIRTMEQIELRYKNLMKKVVPSGRNGTRGHTSDLLRSIRGSIWRMIRCGKFNPGTSESGFIWKVARNKVVEFLRKLGRRPKAVASVEDTDVVDHRELDPAREAELTEMRAEARGLHDKLRSLISDDERKLADLRASGCLWEEVANDSGGTPNAQRMRYNRLLERLQRQTGLTAQQIEGLFEWGLSHDA